MLEHLVQELNGILTILKDELGTLLGVLLGPGRVVDESINGLASRKVGNDVRMEEPKYQTDVRQMEKKL